MTPRAYRVRRVLLWITLGMLGVVVAAWGVSLWGFADHRRSGYRFVEIPVAPDAVRMWRAFVGTSVLQLAEGNFYLEWKRARLSDVSDAERQTFVGLDAQSTVVDRSGPACIVRGPSVYWHGVRSWGLWNLEVLIDNRPAMFECMLRLPLWLPTVAMGGLALWLWYTPRRNRRRAALNQCVVCGYDRRGLAMEAACPECGGKAKGGA